MVTERTGRRLVTQALVTLLVTLITYRCGAGLALVPRAILSADVAIGKLSPLGFDAASALVVITSPVERALLVVHWRWASRVWATVPAPAIPCLMSRPTVVPIPVGSLLRPILLGTSEIPLIRVVRRRTWKAVVVALVERLMRHVVTTVRVTLAPGVPTHPATVRISKRAEPFAKRSLTQN